MFAHRTHLADEGAHHGAPGETGQGINRQNRSNLAGHPLPDTEAGRKRSRLPRRIARDLAAAILSGSYQPGDRLFGEIAFSDRLNVSRATYREAIQILATKGMVSSNPRGGTIVNPRSTWQLLDPEVLGLLFEIGPQAGILDDLHELLDMLVPKAAALAAGRRSVELLAQIDAAAKAMTAETADDNRHRLAFRDFHAALLLASGNAYVMSLARGLAAAIDTCLDLSLRNGAAPGDYVRDHLQIQQAVIDRDSQVTERSTGELIARTFRDLAAPNLPNPTVAAE